MSKHTPSPWVVRESESSLSVSVVGQNGEVVFHESDKRIPGAMDDARLIAAAPELLSILKTLCALDESEVFVKRPWEETFAEARAAIAKVTGGNA